MKRLIFVLLILANVAFCAYMWGVWAGFANSGAYALAIWFVNRPEDSPHGYGNRGH